MDLLRRTSAARNFGAVSLACPKAEAQRRAMRRILTRVMLSLTVERRQACRVEIHGKGVRSQNRGAVRPLRAAPGLRDSSFPAETGGLRESAEDALGAWICLCSVSHLQVHLFSFQRSTCVRRTYGLPGGNDVRALPLCLRRHWDGRVRRWFGGGRGGVSGRCSGVGDRVEGTKPIGSQGIAFQ